MNFKVLPIFLMFIFFASCKKDIKDEFSVIDNSKVQNDLRKYMDYEKRFIKIIKSDQKDLQRIYSDSANFYDSLVNKNVLKLDQNDLFKFNEFVNKIKLQKMEALKNQQQTKQ